MEGKPWVAAIHRLLKAEPRRDPRPKPKTTPLPKFWNGADLAEAAQLQPNTVSNAMTGRGQPGAGTLIAIAEALRVPPAALLMDAEEAEAYILFRQTHTATSQAARLEETVRRAVEQRAVQWIDHETRAIVEGMSSPVPEASGAKGKPKKRTA